MSENTTLSHRCCERYYTTCEECGRLIDRDNACYYGYDEEEIDELLLDGFIPDEIEEYLCCRW